VFRSPGAWSDVCCGRWACGSKKLHATERDTEANLERRKQFLATVAAIPTEKLKFLDESGVTTQMTRLWGRAPKGERVNEATPDGRWQVLTTLGTMSPDGMEAVMTVPSATDGDVFRAYVEQVLCAKLHPGDVVVMDNLSAHKVVGIQQLIEARGAQLLYLPPYSPDLNPIEKAWSKFKQFLRSAKARTAEALDKAITEALKNITPDNAAAWFRSCGYRGYSYCGFALGRHIRPTAQALEIKKRIGWHTFRRTYASLLKSSGADVKVVQESLRHANARITMELYAQALSSDKRKAQSEVLNLFLPFANQQGRQLGVPS